MTPLETSINLWRARVDHLQQVVSDRIPADDTILDAQCPLCKVYKCAECPVAKHTGQAACDGTTYWSYDFCVSKQDWPLALEYARKMLEVLILCQK